MATRKPATAKKGKPMKSTTSRRKVSKLRGGWARKLSPRFLIISLFALGFAFVGYRVLLSRAAAPLKAQIAGVIDRDSSPVSGYGSVVNGWVVQANWADLQPVQGGGIAGNNVIDKAISQARSSGMQLKLRIYGGDSAPAWAKNIGGTPYRIVNNKGQQTHSGTVGRFWLPAYGSAYADFQSKLATKYDGVPEIREVVIDRCSTIFAEPFIRENGVAANRQSYAQAGYSVDQDKQCLKEEVDAHQVWQQTRSSIDLTPFQPATNDGVDVSVTSQIADYCRQQLGARCVIGSNSLQTDNQGPGFQEVYAKIKSLGPPVYFQTATMEKIGSLTAALQKGIDYGAGMVELPAGYQNTPVHTLATYDQKLTAQAQTGDTVSTPPTDGNGNPGTPPPTGGGRHKKGGNGNGNNGGVNVSGSGNCQTNNNTTVCSGSACNFVNGSIICSSNSSNGGQGSNGNNGSNGSNGNNSGSCTINGQPCNGVSGTDGQSTPSVSNNQQNSGGNNGHKSTSRKVLDAVTAPFRAVGRGVKRIFSKGSKGSSQTVNGSPGQPGSSQTVSINQTAQGQPGQSSSSTSQSGNSESQSVSETVVSQGNTGQSSNVSNSSPNTPGVSNSSDVIVTGADGQPGQDNVSSVSQPAKKKSTSQKAIDVVTAPVRAVARVVAAPVKAVKNFVSGSNNSGSSNNGNITVSGGCGTSNPNPDVICGQKSNDAGNNNKVITHGNCALDNNRVTNNGTVTVNCNANYTGGSSNNCGSTGGVGTTNSGNTCNNCGNTGGVGGSNKNNNCNNCGNSNGVGSNNNNNTCNNSGNTGGVGDNNNGNTSNNCGNSNGVGNNNNGNTCNNCGNTGGVGNNNKNNNCSNSGNSGGVGDNNNGNNSSNCGSNSGVGNNNNGNDCNNSGNTGGVGDNNNGNTSNNCGNSNGVGNNNQNNNCKNCGNTGGVGNNNKNTNCNNSGNSNGVGNNNNGPKSLGQRAIEVVTAPVRFIVRGAQKLFGKK